jgi:uncharacterized protein YbjT (DUF2867 family)
MFLVTGATEKVGQVVLAELNARAVPVRVLVEDPATLGPVAANVEVVQADASDEHSLKQALAGVEAAFLAAPLSPKLTEFHSRFAAAAKSVGLPRIVQLSGAGADASQCCIRALRWWGQSETSTQGFPSVTHLRPTFLMQMLLKFYTPAGQQGIIAGPFRAGKWTFVDGRDVGAVAAAAMLDPKFAGRTLTVTGSEELTYAEVAERLSKVLDKQVKYVDITANEARGRLQVAGAPPVMIEATLELWDACASKLINVAPTDVVKEVTGREPRTLEQFVRDYREMFITGWKPPRPEPAGERVGERY